MAQVENRGESLENFPPQVMERPNPPTNAYRNWGRVREATGVPAEDTAGQIVFENLQYRGEPLAKFWPQGSEMPNPSTHIYRHMGADLGDTTDPPVEVTVP